MNAAITILAGAKCCIIYALIQDILIKTVKPFI